jgi:hypothetical protein
MAERRLGEVESARPLLGFFPHGEVASVDVALAANGATVTTDRGINSHVLIDGTTVAAEGGDPNAQGQAPCVWNIELDKTYQLRKIRLKLPDQASHRAFRYAVLMSPDGKNFELLVDRSRVGGYGWQTWQFPPLPVRALRLVGLGGGDGGTFTASELEAFCVP